MRKPKIEWEKISYYKKHLSPLHQLVSRMKDTDDQGYGYCITCNKKIHYSKANGGHCIVRGYGATLYVPENCHIQCPTCNGRLNQGEQFKHGTYINARYGEGKFDELRDLAKNPPKVRPWILCQIFIDRTKELEYHINRIKGNYVTDKDKKYLKTCQNRCVKFQEKLDLLKEQEKLD